MLHIHATFAQTRPKSSKRDVCYPCKPIFPWCKCIYWKGKVVANLYFILPFTTVCNFWANAVFTAFALLIINLTQKYIWFDCKFEQAQANTVFYDKFATHANLSLLGSNVCIYYTPTVEVKLSQMCTCSSVVRKYWLNTRAICRF